MPNEPSWMKLREAAGRAQVSEATLRREAKAGRLRATKIGGRRSWRGRPEWVDAWLEASHQPESPRPSERP